MGARHVKSNSDYQLMVGHMIEKFYVKDHMLLKYYHNMLSGFDTTTTEYIKIEHNIRVNLWLKLTNIKKKIQHH